jgi:putative phage-type endonuclease
MTVIDETAQRSESWFQKRLGKITGSAAADVMNFTAKGEPGAGRKNLIVKLAVERITGQRIDSYQNAAMRRGTELEPEARAAYEAATGYLADQTDFIVHPNFEFIGMSPDCLIEADGLAEIKCPDSQHKHFAALANAAHVREYWWQIQFQLWVAGREWNDAVSYDPRFPKHLQLAISRVHRDEKAIKELEAQCLVVEAEIQASVEFMKKLAV